MSYPLKILLSVRDPGGVGNMAVLFGLMRDDPDLEPILTASGAAARMLEDRGIPFLPFSLPGGTDMISAGEDAGPLLQSARLLLETVRPDRVVTSLSSLGIGVDEALVNLARVPVCTFQDFWGDVNMGLGKAPDLCCVLDAFAADLTAERWGGIVTRITGMPKYMAYEALDLEDLRRSCRQHLGLSSSVNLIGWFGQPPSLPGYPENLKVFLSACDYLGQDSLVLIKPHPKDTGKWGANPCVSGRPGCRIETAPSGIETEALLTACDLAVTSFSLCGLDHAVMTALSPVPLGNMLYLTSNPEIQEFFFQTSGLVRFPIVSDAGGGTWSDEADPLKLGELMQNLMTDRAGKAYADSCRNIIRRFDYQAFKLTLKNLKDCRP